MKHFGNYYYALQDGDRIPRKAKKAILGERMSTCALNRLLKKVEVIEPARTMFQRPKLTTHLFCPKCGCTDYYGTGNKTSYPEHWEYFYCMRCGNNVAYIDNSPFIHALEFKECGFNLDNY